MSDIHLQPLPLFYSWPMERQGQVFQGVGRQFNLDKVTFHFPHYAHAREGYSNLCDDVIVQIPGTAMATGRAALAAV